MATHRGHAVIMSCWRSQVGHGIVRKLCARLVIIVISALMMSLSLLIENNIIDCLRLPLLGPLLGPLALGRPASPSYASRSCTLYLSRFSPTYTIRSSIRFAHCRGCCLRFYCTGYWNTLSLLLHNVGQRVGRI